MENIAASILTIVPAVILVPRVLVVAPMHGVLVMVSVFGVLRTLLTSSMGSVKAATYMLQHHARNMLQEYVATTCYRKSGNMLQATKHAATSLFITYT